MTTSSLSLAVQAGVPTLLWGPPGAGKTSAVQALAGSLGLPCEVVISSLREPADFAGLPIPDGTLPLAGRQVRVVEMAPPAWAVRLAQAGRGLLFLDEISTAPPAVQAALLRVVLDRVVGDLPLPAAVTVVAAANPPEQAAGGWDLAHPLANRFCHLQWQTDAVAWCDGMVSGWAAPTVARLPGTWEVGIPTARAIVAAFVRHRPHLLLRVPQEESAAGRAWPSPRTWDMAARLLAACAAVQAGPDTTATLVAGAVGDGAGLEFLAWRQALDLQDPEALLADPASYRHPSRGDQIFATLAAVAAAAVSRLTRERWMAAWAVMAAATQAGAADMAAAAARALARARRPDLPLPTGQLNALLPVLRAAGLM